MKVSIVLTGALMLCVGGLAVAEEELQCVDLPACEICEETAALPVVLDPPGACSLSQGMEVEHEGMNCSVDSTAYEEASAEFPQGRCRLAMTCLFVTESICAGQEALHDATVCGFLAEELLNGASLCVE